MILRGATLIDGTGAPPLRDRAVVLDDRRIAAVVPDHQARDGAALDLGGLTLLPGLINCHVHLCLSGDADPSRTLSDETYAATVVGAVVHARRTVEAGVTTVRDLGGREYAEIAVRDGVRAGIIAGPRVLCAGRAVCMTGGHGWRMLGRQADGVDEAHRARRRIAAHAMADEGIAWCLDAGIDTIEHGVFLTEALAARMATQGTALVATLIAPHAIVEGGLAAGIPEFAVKKSSALRERHLESFRLALRAGVAIAAGTDAGTPLNPHGTIVPELALMAAAGLEPLQAIRSATSVAARVLGLESETGAVAPGLVADLIAVEGDPATDLKALDAVRLVIADGRTVLNRL